MSKYAVLLLFALLLPIKMMALPAWASADRSAISNTVDEKELVRALDARMDRVTEFRFIRDQAEKMGVKAYLFGGTASGFAHYVRWDLLREHGDRRFQPERFDYDFTNIYRSNQDLDIVVDGTAEQVRALQTALAAHYPYLQGEKSEWEVRSLRESLGPTKMALLNNPDFLNQNSDSNSTGLIEITDSGGPRVRDLFNWGHSESQYLHDIAEGRIHYYNNLLHHTTQRALTEQNPPIMSAVRYLIKAVQFELEMRPEDVVAIRKIIAEFDPKAEKNEYVRKKLEEIGVKLIQNAVNVEYAVNLITRLGLKAKLLEFSDPNKVESLGWWVNREPLPSKPVGLGSGKTAKELGIDVVSHGTRSYAVYESITRGHTGDANILISRGMGAGERALGGDGFYTQKGTNGWHAALSEHIIMSFEVDPSAREGTDFEIVDKKWMVVVFHNKSALRLLPDSINIDLVSYLKSEGKLPLGTKDGTRERLHRRLRNQVQGLSVEQERRGVVELLMSELDAIEAKGAQMMPTDFSIIDAWLRLSPNSDSLPEVRQRLEDLLGKAVKLVSPEVFWKFPLAPTIFSWEKSPELIADFVSRDIASGATKVSAAFLNYDNRENWSSHPELAKKLIQQMINGPRSQKDFPLNQFQMLVSVLPDPKTISFAMDMNVPGLTPRMTSLIPLVSGEAREALLQKASHTPSREFALLLQKPEFRGRLDLRLAMLRLWPLDNFESSGTEFMNALKSYHDGEPSLDLAMAFLESHRFTDALNYAQKVNLFNVYPQFREALAEQAEKLAKEKLGNWCLNDLASKQNPDVDLIFHIIKNTDIADQIFDKAFFSHLEPSDHPLAESILKFMKSKRTGLFKTVKLNSALVHEAFALGYHLRSDVISAHLSCREMFEDI